MYELKPDFKGQEIIVKGFGVVNEFTAKHPKIEMHLKAYPQLLNYIQKTEVKTVK